MKNKHLNKISQLYSKRFNDINLSKMNKIGWGNTKSQKLRFKLLTENFDFKNKTVLDIGCGFGDLYSFIENQYSIKLKKYVGIDVCDDFIVYNQKRFKKKNNTIFINCEANDLKNNNFDYCFISGTFNLKMHNNYNELKKILNYMYSHSKIACGINLLSTNVDYQNPKDFHYNPSKVIDIVQKISKNFKIRHDYPLYEFTIHLIRI